MSGQLTSGDIQDYIEWEIMVIAVL